MSLVDQYVCYLEYIVETIHSKYHFYTNEGDSQGVFAHISFPLNK